MWSDYFFYLMGLPEKKKCPNYNAYSILDMHDLCRYINRIYKKIVLKKKKVKFDTKSML